MDVSHFELVFKPQSPVPPADTVLQGYFLEISNLEDVGLSYQLEFVTSSISDVDRSLFENAIIFVDTPGTDNNDGVFSLNGDLEAKSFFLSKRVFIPAHGTALVAVLPSDPFAMPTDPPDFECRGYVRLTLPPVFKFENGQFTFGPQADDPVQVMLTPQNRATYLSPTGEINDQTQSSVPVASGKALNLLEPLPGILFPDRDFDLDLELTNNLIGSTRPSPEALTAMIAQVGDDPKRLLAVNEMLAKAGLSVGLAPQREAKTRKRGKSGKEAVS